MFLFGIIFNGEVLKLRNIYDLTRKEFEDYFVSIGDKKFRSVQLYEFLYKQPRKKRPVSGRSISTKKTFLIYFILFRLGEAADGLLVDAPHTLEGLAPRFGHALRDDLRRDAALGP